MKGGRRVYQTLEDQNLAPYAIKSSQSRGRFYPEAEHSIRTPFQRDRDRIIHCTAFRRLQYKTQVFVNHEGDHYRTRLTHTLETNQIARTIARAFSLNEDLVEAVALAHDLGHGPFGHAGESALEALMAEYGGFEHNAQCLRIVQTLEESYADFPGLNLTRETLDGLCKHPGSAPGPGATPVRMLEAEVVDIADEIAYSSHDLDDGLRAELITERQVAGLGLWRDAAGYIRKRYRGLNSVKTKRLAIRLVINRLVMDLLENAASRMKKLRIKTRRDLEKTDGHVFGFSPVIARQHEELKKFLYENLYRHYRVVRMTDKGQRFLRALFQAYLEKPEQLPPEARKRLADDGLHRSVCDYLAGMTDRFALDEYKRLFEPYERV